MKQFANKLQEQRGLRRRQLERYYSRRLGRFTIEELQKRLSKAKRPFARRLLKRAIRLKTSKKATGLFIPTRIRSHEIRYQLYQVESEVRRIYWGSDAGSTRRLHAKLERLGHAGCIAATLLRAQKASSRAKRYHSYSWGGNRKPYSEFAYESKGKAISKLCSLLLQDSLGMTWGWQEDLSQSWAPWVVYLDLPTGQVSFHSTERMEGPDYDSQWDRSHQSEQRIISYCESLLNNYTLA